MKFSLELHETKPLMAAQPEGTFLIFGDNEIDSVMIKKGGFWRFHRAGYEYASAYEDDRVAAWIIGETPYTWSLS